MIYMKIRYKKRSDIMALIFAGYRSVPLLVVVVVIGSNCPIRTELTFGVMPQPPRRWGESCISEAIPIRHVMQSAFCALVMVFPLYPQVLRQLIMSETTSMRHDLQLPETPALLRQVFSWLTVGRVEK